ncbi:hypothetical protein CK203_014997 [Vitis vinifera]|uniref:GRF-type domain-containing protein n=1 Tax=Vitis vinifera TaxID=29760 RepID=A0A438JCP7_VITVI|nr:hypothetical protein CK203_014997 [Vitis vinifera]
MELAREAQSSIRSQSHRTEGGTCFHCQKHGHWARARPYKSPNDKPLSIDSPDFPDIQCRCGAGTCVIRISRTPRNPGRKFYACPAKMMGGDCNFFKWCDTVTDHEISKSPQSPPPPSSIPMCSCGAGICRISMEKFGPNAGRRSFICPVKKDKEFINVFFPKLGYGEQLFGLELNFDEKEKGDSDSPELAPHNTKSILWLLNIFLYAKQTYGSECIHCHMPQGQGACNFFQWEDAQVNTKVNDVDETKQCSTHQSAGISQQDTETGKSCSLKEEPLSFQHLERVENSPVKENSCPSNPEAVLGLSEERNMLLIEDRGHDEISKFHSLKLHNAADVTSLGVFPSYDPIFVPTDVECDVECLSNLSQSPSDLLRLTHGQDAQTLDVLLEPPGLTNPPNILGGNAVISGSIWAAFRQAALHVQNELLTLLELMNPQDHESMVREANSAFAGLDRLGIDYRPFYERVKKFIGCASTLAQIESTIRNDLASQELMNSYRSKMSHYENISRVHSKAMGAFTSSDDRLHFLQKEAIRVREMLLQIETQLSCCEVETAVLEIHLLQISQDMLETKQNLEGVYKAAGQNHPTSTAERS